MKPDADAMSQNPMPAAAQPPKLTKKENVRQAVKYFLFASSAGAIQVISFALLLEFNVFRDVGSKYGPSYFVALVLSVLWNFTFNRKLTFQSACNVPVAMLKVFAYYLVFTPASVWWGNALTRAFPQHWMEYVILVGTMLVNGVTEFLYQRCYVFRDSINSAKKPSHAEPR